MTAEMITCKEKFGCEQFDAIVSIGVPELQKETHKNWNENDVETALSTTVTNACDGLYDEGKKPNAGCPKVVDAIETRNKLEQADA